MWRYDKKVPLFDVPEKDVGRQALSHARLDARRMRESVFVNFANYLPNNRRALPSRIFAFSSSVRSIFSNASNVRFNEICG